MSEPTEQQVQAAIRKVWENEFNHLIDTPLFRATVEAASAAAPRHAEGWQPISSAPRDGTEIWLGREGRLILGYWSGKRGWMREGLQGEDERVMSEATHWQQHTVPEPPAGDEEQKS